MTAPPDPFADGLPTFERAGVRLRALAPRDREAVFALYADREAIRFGYAPKMDDTGDADLLIEETARLVAARTIFHWGVSLPEDDAIIGHATLFKVERAHGRAEIGYSIRRDHWGRGLGTRAAGALLAFAFEVLELRRIEADVDPRNVASLRVLEHHGFVREGYVRERWLIAGELQDGVILGLLRRDWPGVGSVVDR